jgi:hypothetical protein
MNPIRLSLAGASVLAVALLVPACQAEVEPEPVVGYAQVTSAPADIETYPYVVYEGRPVYYYGDHWWYRDGSNWSYYRDEPAELHRQRGYVQRAPRAYRGRAPVERREVPREVAPRAGHER